MSDGPEDIRRMRQALRLARRGYGTTSPNPMVGALVVRGNRLLGSGWHQRAGGPHAEVAALEQARRRGHRLRGATLYVTLEPCCTHGRTPPCTDAVIAAGIRRVVVAATDPNPLHAGRGFAMLRAAGIDVVTGVLAAEATRLNEVFNHWILHHTPFVTVKAAMTLDGRIATASGDSKWVTGGAARAEGWRLRAGVDAILVGINTVLADDPALTVRSAPGVPAGLVGKPLRRLVLDTRARTPLTAVLLNDAHAGSTVIVVGQGAPARRVAALQRRVTVWAAPLRDGCPDLSWLLDRLGAEGVTSLLVEGGGEVNAAFLLGGHAHRAAFFYAPKVLGGDAARRGVAGDGIRRVADRLRLAEVEYRRLGPDLMVTSRVVARA